MTKYIIDASSRKARIHKEIYGQFAEHLGRGIYGGIYVGEGSEIPNVNGMRCDVVDALREIRVPVLRWPGGCFADEYHWRDGVGPKEGRKHMINTHWGGVTEDNSFGTHEFFELCRQLGCEAYVNGNVGSGTVQEMSEWVEYMTFGGVSPMAEMRKANGRAEPWDVAWFAVGNETWGCGGNMLPEHYAALYRNYQTYVRNYDPDKKIRKICSGANVDDYEWTEKVLETCFRRCDSAEHGYMDGISLHYYVLPDGWENKQCAADFGKDDFYKTIAKASYMEELVERHSAILDKYDPEGRIGLIVDEWGTWYKVEPGTNPGFLYQQNTMRDAMVAAMTLNIFNKHAGRVRMANIAQMVNVLQSMILTEENSTGEEAGAGGADGAGGRACIVKTPTYHVFDLFKDHQDAELLDSRIETKIVGTDDWHIPNLTESASISADGTVNLTIANMDLENEYEIEAEIRGLENMLASTVTGRILCGNMHGMNTFENPESVSIQSFDQAKVADGMVLFTIPPCSVINLQVR